MTTHERIGVALDALDATRRALEGLDLDTGDEEVSEALADALVAVESHIGALHALQQECV